MNAQTDIQADPQATLIGALANALPSLGAVHKNKQNPHFKSSYADLAAVIQALAPLAEHGLWFQQVPIDCDNGLAYETFYIHADGARMSAGITTMPVDKNNAQGYGSAQTYCRRYALMAAFGLAADDDDGNAAAKAEPAEKPKREPAHSVLKTQVRAFVHELEGCGDDSELSAFLNSKESKKLISDVETKMPAWWETGEGEPEEFIPLKKRIANKEYEMAQKVADLAGA